MKELGPGLNWQLGLSLVCPYERCEETIRSKVKHYFVKNSAYVICLLIFLLIVCASSPAQSRRKLRRQKPDVPFVVSVDEVVNAMLATAQVNSRDVVYDLGCGDGKVVIAAAKQYEARGVGIDINPKRIREAQRNAQQAGVSKLVEFKEENLFQANISAATVVALYLDPAANLKLRPKLWRELKPGTRIVSNSFDMGDWKPERIVKVMSGGSECTIYYWVIPG